MDSTLTWVHAEDVAEAILRALEKEGNEGEKYLIGKHTLTMGELSRMVCEIYTPIRQAIEEEVAFHRSEPLPWANSRDLFTSGHSGE